MKVQKDYEEFLELLNKNSVKYCVVGSFALALYATPRYTKDMDILIEPEEQNAKAVLRALREFGFDSPDLSAADFLKTDQVVQLGYEPVRIDILTKIPGCTFDEVWRTKYIAKYGKTVSNFAGRDTLIQSKRATGRKQDLADIELLEQG